MSFEEDVKVIVEYFDKKEKTKMKNEFTIFVNREDGTVLTHYQVVEEIEGKIAALPEEDFYEWIDNFYFASDILAMSCEERDGLYSEWEDGERDSLWDEVECEYTRYTFYSDSPITMEEG